MTRIAFYIAERPQSSAILLCGEVKSPDTKLGGMSENGSTSSLVQRGENLSSSDEYKDDYEISDNESNLAPIDDMDQWVYVEDISLDYAFAQSVLFKIAGGSIQETGHKTKGHACLTDGDKYISKLPDAKGSLLYGELLPRGANKAFGSTHLNAADAKVLFDLGMGTGKVAIQAFLQFRNLEYVYGVELSEGRFKVAEEYVRRMVQLLGSELYTIDTLDHGRRLVVTEAAPVTGAKSRVLEMECGDMFDVQNIHVADIVMMETDIPVALHTELCNFLNDMHPGARTLSYLDLRKVWHYDPFTFKQLDANRHLSDRFPTSWSVQRGHHFFLWTKVTTAKLVSKHIPEDASSGTKKRFSSGKFFSSSSSSGSAHGSGRGSSFVTGRGDEDVEGTTTQSFAEYFSRCTPHSLYSSLSSMFLFRRSSRKKSRKSRSGGSPSSLFGLPGAGPTDKICPMDDTTSEYAAASAATSTISNDIVVAAERNHRSGGAKHRATGGTNSGSEMSEDEQQVPPSSSSSLAMTVPVLSPTGAGAPVIGGRAGSPGADDESTAYPSPTIGAIGTGAQLPLSEKMLQTPSSSPTRETGKSYQASNPGSGAGTGDEQHLLELETHTSPASGRGRLNIDPEDGGAGRSPNLAWAIPSKATGSASGGGDGLASTTSPSAALAAPTSANFGGTSVIGSSVGADVPPPGLSDNVPAAMAALLEMAKTNIAADVSASAPGQPHAQMVVDGPGLSQSSSSGGGDGLREAQIEAEMATSSSMGARGDASASQSQASKMAGYNAARAASLSSNYVNSSSFVEVSFNTTRINETAVDGRAGAEADAGLLEADTGAAVSTASSSNIDLVRSFSDVGGTGTGTGTGGDANLAST